MPSKIDPTVRERALRMIADHRRDYPSDTALATAVAGRLGVGRETVRRWLVQPTSTRVAGRGRAATSRPRSNGCGRRTTADGADNSGLTLRSCGGPFCGV
jgi:hypothetical protein